MKEKIQKFREYLDYIEEHYNNVQKAWALVKDKCPNNKFRFLHDDYVYWSIDSEVKSHDLSKLSSEEFTQYRQYFFPTEDEEGDEELMEKAWEHHKECNNHHWEHWTEKQAGNPYADIFVVLMVIDWVAMGFKFGDTAKDYYESHKDEIKLPDWAVKLMYEIFECIY